VNAEKSVVQHHLADSMTEMLGETACNCSVESARLLLEASGFTISFRNTVFDNPPYSASKRDEVFTLYCTIVAVLVLIAGLMSGLTLGLMSLDGLDLEVDQLPISAALLLTWPVVLSCLRYTCNCETDLLQCPGNTQPPSYR